MVTASAATNTTQSAIAEVRVDVLVAAYNAEATIGDAIASLQHQTLRAIRIVVVDDGSTDCTASIVTARALDDPRIVVLRKTHGGIVDTLRVGLAHCKAPLLARFDADDLSYPERLERQCAQLDANPDWIAVASAARHVDRAGQWLGTVTDFAPPDRADATWLPAREPYMLQPFLMIRRAALDAAGAYRQCEVAEDSDLYWRLSEVGIMTNTKDVLGDYRWHAGSVSSRSIVHGRRIAFWSQLVALSALRRARGATDLVFDQARLDATATATSLDDHCRLGGSDLMPDEQIRLRAATAAKLLEVVNYRPFELERDDCRFARKAFAAMRPHVGPENRDELDSSVRDATMRLIFKGAWAEAFLLDPSRFPRLVGHWAARTCLPDALRRRLKRVLRLPATNTTTND